MAKTLPITGLPIGGVSPDVIVCGDPRRADLVAGFLQDVWLLADQREYRSYYGKNGGHTVTVCSHGIGAPGAAIAFEELIVAGARRIVRVGTCGGLQPIVRDGHLIVASAAVQNTGYLLEIAPRGYPAVADPELTIALRRAVKEKEQPAHMGLVLTRDAFYGGVQGPFLPDYEDMARANVLAVEMECAALFTVGSLRRVPTAAILAVDGNVMETKESVESYKPHREIVAQAVAAAITCALSVLRGSTQVSA
jgi:uridine phosphorylase